MNNTREKELVKELVKHILFIESNRLTVKTMYDVETPEGLYELVYEDTETVAYSSYDDYQDHKNRLIEQYEITEFWNE